MIKSVFGLGRNSDARQCVLEAVRDIKSPKLIFFFSGEEHFSQYSEILNELYPDTVCIGCSAYKTWNTLEVANDALNVMAIEDGITCAAGVIEKADNYALGYADNVRDACDKIGISDNTVCVEFTVPRKFAEEYSIMTLNSVLLNKGIPVIGCTAACIHEDTGTTAEGLVSLNGEIYREGCVFVLIHNVNGKIVLRSENIYEPLTGKEFTVTKANDLTRTIMRLDNRAASDVYAEELCVPREEIASNFFHYPMGQQLADKSFITAISGEGSNGSMKFHARVHEGAKMMVMAEGDYKAITRRTIMELKRKVENPSLVLMFHCVARTILFEENGYINEYQKLLAKSFSNFIGISCLGEQMGTKNFNHTNLLAIFE